MTELANFTYCRLCLNKLNQNDALYLLAPSYSNASAVNELNSSTTLLDLVNKYLPKHLNYSNGLSLYMCLCCSARFEDFEKYIESVIENQQQLEDQETNLSALVGESKEPVWEIKLELNVENDDIPDTNENLHLRTEKQAKKFTCDICGLTVYSKSGLTLHTKSKHPSLPTSKRIEDRQKTKTPASTPQFECDLCGFTCTKKETITSHIVKNHTTTDPPRAEKVKQNAQAIAKYLKCDLCDNELFYKSFAELAEHFRDEHDTKAYIRCCDKKFFTRRSVINHENMHTRPTDFMCQVCGKLLPNQYHLRDHVARHGDDSQKKHFCTICDKRFHLRHDLTDHIRKKHKQKKPEEPAVCDICKKT